MDKTSVKVSAGGCRDGVGEGGAGVEEPNKFLIAVKGDVKLLKRLLEGVAGLSLAAGVEDSGAGRISGSRGGEVAFGALAASWTCRSNATADSSPVAKDDCGASDWSTSKESNSDRVRLALTGEVFKDVCWWSCSSSSTIRARSWDTSTRRVLHVASSFVLRVWRSRKSCSLFVKKTPTSSLSSSSMTGGCAGAGVFADAFLEVVRGLLAGCSSKARSGEAASVSERRRRFVAGVDATASERVAGCALRVRDVVLGGVVSRSLLMVVDFLEVAAALRVGARVRLLARVSTTVTISSVVSAAAAVRRVRRVDIVLLLQ